MKDVSLEALARITCQKRCERAEWAIYASRMPNDLKRFDFIKKFYRSAYEEIMAKPNQWGIDPYEIDWTMLFTPIEASIWHEIRHYGLVMYPQLPVGRFFVDFGNPHAKVAIECDGALYHDRAADEIRDTELADRGWRVYRISGRECLQEMEDDAEPGDTPAAAFVKYVRSEIDRRLEKRT